MSMSYPDANRILNNPDTQSDVVGSSQRLAKSTVKLIQDFDGVAAQLHSIDLQGMNAPILPQWNTLRQNFRELVWQIRTNAGLIAGRLKMFCTLVLPLAVSDLSGGSNRSMQEKFQVLQSFMGVSSEHAALTRSLAENVLKLNTTFNAFHSNFARFTSSRLSSGQNELRSLQQKVSDLESQLKQLYIAIGRLVGVEVGFLLYSAFRVIVSSERSGKAKVARHRLTLIGPEVSAIGRMHEQLDRSRNEIAHADYAAQVSHRKADSLTAARTSLTTLMLDQMFSIEASLSLFLSVWSRLQTDCTEILKWLQRGGSQKDLPPSLSSFVQSGHSLYTCLAQSLDTFVVAIDPSLFSK